ncbi:MAG: hypothetical protein EA392_09220 [Cryomorphaceae bacterium]|nr:MAG: hypothetical protein EA392_09220 [Cryomorphaceae bacterium]
MRIFLILIGTCLVLSTNAQDVQILKGAEHQYELAKEAYAEERYDEALKYLNTSIMSTKRNPDMYILRAKVLLKINQNKRALRDLNKASRIGSYKADLMLDSLLGRSKDTKSNQQFIEDLEEYLNE